jgi:hypothetical protein
MKASDKQVGGLHYRLLAIQPTKFIYRNNLNFIEGNVIKYVCRHREKNGKDDLEKAIHYLQLLIEYEYEQKAMVGSHDDMPADNHFGLDLLSEYGGD